MELAVTIFVAGWQVHRIAFCADAVEDRLELFECQPAAHVEIRRVHRRAQRGRSLSVEQVVGARADLREDALDLFLPSNVRARRGNHHLGGECEDERWPAQ